MLLRRAGNVRRCRQKSSSPKEDPFHNRATAMNFEEGEGWLQRLVGTTGRTTTEFERYKAAAKAAVKTDAGLKSGDELLFAGEDGDWLKKLESSSEARQPRTPKVTKTARTTRRLEAISKFSLTPRELKGPPRHVRHRPGRGEEGARGRADGPLPARAARPGRPRPTPGRAVPQAERAAPGTERRGQDRVAPSRAVGCRRAVGRRGRDGLLGHGLRGAGRVRRRGAAGRRGRRGPRPRVLRRRVCR